MKNIISLALALLFAASLVAQSKPAAKTRFASVYTNFTSNCKSYDGENGSDGYSICRGPGGYKIQNYFAAAAALYVASFKDENASYGFPMLALDFDDRKTKVEWRTANGKPFAMIMRIPTYGPAKEGKYFGPVNGEELFVRGLKGFDFETKVDAKTPGANAKARELADAEYLRIVKN
jgi:hypothetical protein